MAEPGPDPVEQIEDLERRIAELEDAIARSRKLRSAGRAASIAGPALIVALIAGVPAFTPARALMAFALFIGGMVLAGASRASTDALDRRLQRAKAERDAAIDALGLACAGDRED